MARGRAPSADRQADLCSLLRSLDLTYAATSFGDLALKAAKAGLTHEAFLYELVRGECEYRTQRRIERDLRRPKLPHERPSLRSIWRASAPRSDCRSNACGPARSWRRPPTASPWADRASARAIWPLRWGTN